MMLSKEERAEIAENFARRNGGVYSPALFVEEVREQGRNHPAYGWFEWSDDQAAEKWRVRQAREFVRDIKIRFEVVTIRDSAKFKIRTEEGPAYLSPMDGRSEGGGYRLQNPDDYDISEHCLQAGVALRSWLRRYGAALDHIDVKQTTIERYIDALEGVREKDAAA